MSKNKVTRLQAQEVVVAIRATYNLQPGAEGPNLRDNDHEELPEGCWSVDWEEGPYEWALDYAGVDRDLKGVFLEPINSFILGIFPA